MGLFDWLKPKPKVTPIIPPTPEQQKAQQEFLKKVATPEQYTQVQKVETTLNIPTSQRITTGGGGGSYNLATQTYTSPTGEQQSMASKDVPVGTTIITPTLTKEQLEAQKLGLGAPVVSAYKPPITTIPEAKPLSKIWGEVIGYVSGLADKKTEVDYIKLQQQYMQEAFGLKGKPFVPSGRGTMIYELKPEEELDFGAALFRKEVEEELPVSVKVQIDIENKLADISSAAQERVNERAISATSQEEIDKIVNQETEKAEKEWKKWISDYSKTEEGSAIERAETRFKNLYKERYGKEYIAPKEFKPVTFKEIDWGKTLLGKPSEKPVAAEWIETQFSKVDKITSGIIGKLGAPKFLTEQKYPFAITDVGKFILFSPFMKTGVYEEEELDPVLKFIKSQRKGLQLEPPKVKPTKTLSDIVRPFEKAYAKGGDSAVQKALIDLAKKIAKESDLAKKAVMQRNLQEVLRDLSYKGIVKGFVYDSYSGKLLFGDPASLYAAGYRPTTPTFGIPPVEIKYFGALGAIPKEKPSVEKEVPVSKAEERLNAVFGLVTPTKTREKEVTKTLGANLSNLLVGEMQTPRLAQAQLQNQMQKLFAPQLQVPRFKYPAPQIPKPTIPKIPIVFPYWKRKETPAERRKQLSYKKQMAKQAREYQASVAAFSLGLYAPKGFKPKKIFTGGEIRPLLFEVPRKSKKNNYLKQLNKIFS